MKSRIGKLEGEGRISKRMQEGLGKHVKILENALRREREKIKKLQQGDASAEDQSKPNVTKDDTKTGDKGKRPVTQLVHESRLISWQLLCPNLGKDLENLQWMIWKMLHTETSDRITNGRSHGFF